MNYFRQFYLIYLFITLSIPFSLSAQYNFIGTASLEPGDPDHCIRITPNVQNSKGWVYSTSRFDLSVDTAVEFDLYVGNDDAGADGVIFILHNDPRDYNASGDSGSALGYDGPTGVNPSFGVEIDTHPNTFRNDPTNDHVSFVMNANVTHPAVFEGHTFPTNIENNVQHRFRFEWKVATQTVNIFWEGNLILSKTTNLSTLLGTNQPYWGFSGSTGNRINQQYFCSELGVTLNDPLPIRLLNFTAQQADNQIVLKWTTANELNNKSFVLERSNDGLTFSTIKTLDGAGNSNSLLHYQTIDENPFKGINYYRLKQIDFDEKFTYSGLVYVNFINSNQTPYWISFPNPIKSKTELKLQVNFFENPQLQLSVQNLLGREVLTKTIKNNDLNNFMIDLPTGVYILIITDRQKVYKQKLIIE